jgi:hypothetical protein
MERGAIATPSESARSARATPRSATRSSHGAGITIHDPLLPAFTPADCFFHHYLVLGFRYDKRLVPPKLLMLERRRLEERAQGDARVSKLGAAERREIKDEIHERLIARALPTPRLFDVVWNVDTGRVYFSGKLRAARDAFTDCFRETFGVVPVPLIRNLAAEHMGLKPSQVDAFRAVEPATFVGVGEPPASDDVPRLPIAPPVYESEVEEELVE